MQLEFACNFAETVNLKALQGHRNVKDLAGTSLCDGRNLPSLIGVAFTYLPKLVEDQSPSFHKHRCPWYLLILLSYLPITLKYRIKEHTGLLIFNNLPPMLTLILPCLFINFWILPLLLVYSVFPKKTHGTATL